MVDRNDNNMSEKSNGLKEYSMYIKKHNEKK